MKYVVLLPYLKEPASGLCLQQDESRLHFSILYSFMIHFNIILNLLLYLPRDFFPQVIEPITLPFHTCSAILINLILYLGNKILLQFVFYLKLIFK
jgi:hypothetical protein